MTAQVGDRDLFDPRAVYDLSGRAAIVTGAADGIGRAIARLFASAGANVLCADISDKVDQTVALIAADGGSAVAHRIDVSRQRDVEAMIETAVQRFGALDVIVNNAAVIQNHLTAELEEDVLDQHLAVNLKGVFFCCKAAARVMAAQGHGSIINIASSAIDLGLPKTVAYSMCKAAVAQLTKCLAAEVGPRNVRVNTIAPGWVITPMTSRHFSNPDGSIDEAKKQQMVADYSRGLPLSETIEPVDIAHSALFLASSAARRVTGQILRPNNGVSMPW